VSGVPFSPAVLERTLRRLLPGWPKVRLLLALSGGADSVALLAALAELRSDPGCRGLEVRALHIDHGLQPQAPAWARAARGVARRSGIRFGVRRAAVRVRAGESLEARARAARYGLLAAALRRGEILVTAHHEDDQAETLLLQLLRGAGVAGLAAMPESVAFGGGRLVRPLLGVSRSALRDWARLRGLHWVEDGSNADERFDRNFLRRVVLPPLATRWPRATHVIARAAGHLGEARALLAEVGDADLARVEQAATLDIERLRRLSLPRQRNLVRRWIERHSLPMPDRLRLERILGELCDARADALPVVAWSGAEVRRWRGRLHVMATLPPAPEPMLWRLATSRELALPGGLGRLKLVADPRGPLALRRLPRALRVSFRSGGERLCTEAGGPRRRLKELLRAGDVLPWMRDRIPLVHAGERLLQVGNLWCDADAMASPRVRRRARIEWLDAPAVKS
jgi:tRNA(Ile)-lysidine synthase